MNLAHALAEQLRDRVVRTFRQFAEEEIVLPPGGPLAGLRFRCDTQPFSALLFEQFDAAQKLGARFNEFWCYAPVQDGKTLFFAGVPVCYHAFEIGENIIIGGPTMELIHGWWEEKMLPVIERMPRYAKLLPTAGEGSKGGKATLLRLKNGASIRFMPAGGGDQQRSSHTARVIVMTEIDKMAEAGEASKETDPVSQIMSRAASFGALGPNPIVYAECTVSDKDGRIFAEVSDAGTDTRPFFPCPKCGAYQEPTRSALTGWQAARDAIEARDNVRWQCAACRAQLTEDERQQALARPVLVSRGQTVGADGVVTGPMPRTRKFGLRWNALGSRLKRMADIAELEWSAEKDDDEAKRKQLAQFWWAVPYENRSINLWTLRSERVVSKVTNHERGAIPSDTVALVLGGDVGSWTCWWTLLAIRENRQRHVVDYGSLKVPGDETNPEVRGPAILTTLRQFRDDHVATGWHGRVPDVCVWDSSWNPTGEIGQKSIVYQFTAESGPRCFPSKGLGTRVKQDAWKPVQHAKQSGREWSLVEIESGLWLFEIHADYWKDQVHQGFGAAPGTPGSITIFNAPREQHAFFAKHITAEEKQPLYDKVTRKVVGFVWVEKSQTNHWLDCVSNACAAADMLEMIGPPKAAAKASAQRAERSDAPNKWARPMGSMY